MFGLTHLLGFLFAPFFWSPTPTVPPAHQFYTELDASSTAPGYVVVHSNINGVSSTTVVHAPYGIHSEVESFLNGTSTETFASSTPITQSDIAQVQAQQQAFAADMQREIQDEQKMFQDMWNGSDF